MSDDTVLPCSQTPVDALPVDLDYITEELKVRAKAELFEDEKTKVQSLKLLRSMLEKEQYLRWQDDDLFLLAFLRTRKFDVKRAFNHIKGLYSNFGKHGNLYYGLSFDDFRRIMEENTVYFLPYRDSQNSVILITRFAGWNPETTSAEEFMVCATLGFFQALRSPMTQVAGFQFILDFNGFTFKHLLSVRPSVIGFFIEVIQNTVPARMRGFHAVNENYLFSYIWPIVKQIVSKKIRDRIHIHGNEMKSLHKFFHPSILPADFGGELPPFNNADWRERMEASADYIKHVLSFGYEKYLKKDWKKKPRKITEK